MQRHRDRTPTERATMGRSRRGRSSGRAEGITAVDTGRATAGGERPWLAWSVGDRVVVRYRITRERPGGPGHTDALGYLIACNSERVTVRTRSGDVTIPAEAIALGKLVPPPPAPRR